MGMSEIILTGRKTQIKKERNYYHITALVTSYSSALVPSALCILWSGVLKRSFGVEYWNGVESNFEVENTLVLFIIIYHRTCVKVKNE